MVDRWLTYFICLMMRSSVIGSLLVVTGLYVLLWGKAKEAEEYETAKQLAQLAQARQEDAHCNL